MPIVINDILFLICLEGLPHFIKLAMDFAHFDLEKITHLLVIFSLEVFIGIFSVQKIIKPIIKQSQSSSIELLVHLIEISIVIGLEISLDAFYLALADVKNVHVDLLLILS